MFRKTGYPSPNGHAAVNLRFSPERKKSSTAVLIREAVLIQTSKANMATAFGYLRGGFPDKLTGV